MGKALSVIVDAVAGENEFIKNEKLSWVKDHSLEVDIPSSEQYAGLLDQHFPDGSELKMCYRAFNVSGVEYFHYFVLSEDLRWVIEFGGGDLSDNIVLLQSSRHKNYNIAHKFTMDEKKRSRIKRVLGARNYSLALRNCEHVAYYIYCGSWISTQMCSEATLHVIFKNYLSVAQKLVNKLPRELDAPHPLTALYEGQTGCIQNGRIVQAPAFDNDAFNIVFIGPTGSGKSSLINRLFNLTLCDTGNSAESVTSNFASYEGDGTVGGQHRKIVVTDTIGFCDSKLDSNLVLSLVKNFIKCNFAHVDRVVVVCSGRIEAVHQESIKQLLTWLEFYKRPRKDRFPFSFVYNKADLSGEGEAERSVATMADRLETGMCETIVNTTKQKLFLNMSVGIPPSADFAESEAHLDNLQSVLFLQYDAYSEDRFRRIHVQPDSMCAIM